MLSPPNSNFMSSKVVDSPSMGKKAGKRWDGLQFRSISSLPSITSYQTTLSLILTTNMPLRPKMFSALTQQSLYPLSYPHLLLFFSLVKRTFLHLLLLPTHNHGCIMNGIWSNLCAARSENWSLSVSLVNRRKERDRMKEDGLFAMEKRREIAKRKEGETVVSKRKPKSTVCKRWNQRMEP